MVTRRTSGKAVSTRRARAPDRRPNSKATTTTRAAPGRKRSPEDARQTTIVGVGASAGGLEAVSALLRALPQFPGLAIVLVQHLMPQHESALPALLAATTKLPVVQAAEGMRVEPNHVYVVPPNVQMAIADGVLHLMPRPRDKSQYVPIDFFLRSLADSAQERAIGVILSGTASDGAVGVRDIKTVGGITLAQDPASAKYDGMPRAAIATGMVDLVLPPDRLAAELVEIARHPYLRRPPLAPIEKPGDEQDASPLLRDEQLERIFTMLRTSSGIDFRHYKLPTIERRLQRRMVLQKLTNIDQYLQYLQDHPGEVQALHQDLLIHVTRFFREPDSFTALAERIFPDIIDRHTGDNPIRVWVAGCSSGEEAYSVAMTLLETLGDRVDSAPIQVFATDVSDHAVEHARNGTYPESIAVDVSPERLRRFFTKVEGGYRVTKTLRDICIFARQDLTRDPPFSKLDLVVCRNVLVYMTSALQNRLLTIFHYALKPNGYLMLGHAETIDSMSGLFAIEENQHRIYRKESTDTTLPAMSFHAERVPSVTPPRKRIEGTADHSAQHEADRIALERYAPPGVIVDEDLQIVQFRGQTGLFLEPAPGDPSMSLLKMAREGLLHGVRAAFHAARRSGGAVRKDGLKVKQNGSWCDVGVEVIPLGTSGRNHFLILFHTGRQQKDAEAPTARPAKGAKRDDERLQRLEAELAASREYLHSIIQEVEAANDELQSANEEILSSNEELQSTNEELDTAKEELQSTIEELNTLNEELHGRNAELSRANSDLVNLLGSIQIAIVIVASDLRIRRFTPMAERVLNLIASDVGRPIGHIKPNIDCPDLEQLITLAIDTVVPQEREVRDGEGNVFSLRIRPYKNVENRIDGAVLALFDVQPQPSDGVRQRRDIDLLLQGVPVPLLLLDQDLHIREANEAFCRLFGYRRDAIAGRDLFGVGKNAWATPKLRAHLATAQHDGGGSLAIRHRFPRMGDTQLWVGARRVDGLIDQGAAVLVTLLDGAPPGEE